MKNTVLKRFCPKCGKECEKIFKGLCRDCFSEKEFSNVLPAEIVVEKCTRCGKLRFKGKWFEQSGHLLGQIIESKKNSKDFDLKILQTIFEPVDEKKTTATAVFGGLIGESVFKFEKQAILFFQKTICDPCMRTTSYYYEATVQVRFENKFSEKDSEKVLKKIHEIIDHLHKLDSLAKIINVLRQKTGFDVLIGSRKAGKIVSETIAKEFNSATKSSFTLVGIDSSGNEKKRHTYCIRIKN